MPGDGSLDRVACPRTKPRIEDIGDRTPVRCGQADQQLVLNVAADPRDGGPARAAGMLDPEPVQLAATSVGGGDRDVRSE